METGIVYCIYNPLLDGMVKIGITKRTVNDRIKDLNTSLPESFECAFYIKHINYKSIEKELHQIFGVIP
jgi:hypothetical protein